MKDWAAPLATLILVVAALVATSAPGEPPFLLVLGIAQDGGLPHAGCERSCCAKAFAGEEPPVPVSSLGLVDPARRSTWLFDATPDLPTQLERLSREGELAGIFLTHAHIGHYLGLAHLGREVMGADAVPVYAMPRMTRFLESNGPWDQLVRLGNIELRPLEADRPVALTPEISVTPFVVPHRDEYSETVGFRIEGPARSAVYLPDIDKWGRWARPVEELVRSVDVAFLDATFFDEDELPGRDMSEVPHPFVVESLERLGSLSAEERARVRFIHLNHGNPLLREDGEARERVHEAGMGVAEVGGTVEL